MVPVKLVPVLPWWLQPELIDVVAPLVMVTLTAVYVLVSAAMWRATRSAAEATKQAANAAREQAALTLQAFETSHRPYCALTEITCGYMSSADGNRMTLRVFGKNLGNTPARILSRKFWINAANFQDQVAPPPGRDILLPNDMFDFRYDLENCPVFREISNRTIPFRIRASIRYESIVTHSSYESSFTMEWPAYLDRDRPERGGEVVESEMS